MLALLGRQIAIAFALLFLFAPLSGAAEQKLGFVTEVYGEGFFLNPLVTKILVTEVSKGSLAEAAGMRTGDLIVQIEGQTIAGRRAFELQRFMKLNAGETRSLRVRHSDGTEADVRITKPKS